MIFTLVLRSFRFLKCRTSLDFFIFSKTPSFPESRQGSVSITIDWRSNEFKKAGNSFWMSFTASILTEQTSTVSLRKPWQLPGLFSRTYAKQQREMTNFYVAVSGTRTTATNFSYFHLKLNAVVACLAKHVLESLAYRTDLGNREFRL